MLTLTVQDCSFLRDLTQEVEKVEKGFSLYASEEMVLDFHCLNKQKGICLGNVCSQNERRKKFFKENVPKLLERLQFVGKSRDDLYSLEFRDQIAKIANALGFPASNLEDFVSEVFIKLFRHHYLEAYNPLRASWKHYIGVPIKRSRASYYGKQKRDAISLSKSISAYEDSQGKEWELDLYEVNQEFLQDGRLLLEEVLDDFRTYLTRQTPKKSIVLKPYKEICKIHPLQTYEQKRKVPAEENRVIFPQIAFIVRRGKGTYRVKLLDGRSTRWPIELITDIRENDQFLVSTGEVFPRTFDKLFDLVMGKYQEGKVIKETDYGVAQVCQIASLMNIGDSTAFAWITGEGGLEEHFRRWWVESPFIPEHQKWKAQKTICCPHCKHHHLDRPFLTLKEAVLFESRRVGVFSEKVKKHWISPILMKKNQPKQEPHLVLASWCEFCGLFSLDEVDAFYTIPYPWGKIRGNQTLKEKTKKKKRMTIQICRI